MRLRVWKAESKQYIQAVAFPAITWLRIYAFRQSLASKKRMQMFDFRKRKSKYKFRIRMWESNLPALSPSCSLPSNLKVLFPASMLFSLFRFLISWMSRYPCKTCKTLKTCKKNWAEALAWQLQINKLLQPAFRWTMRPNADARQNLISADGIIESAFTVGSWSMPLISKIYGAEWTFDTQSLPDDLLAR